MKTINISEKTFNNLKPLILSNKIHNGEAQIFDYHYHNQAKVLKKLYNNKGYNFANKLYTVEMLDAFRELMPDSLVIPDYLVSVNHETVGFTSPKIDGINLSLVLENKKILLVEKKKYLKTIGELLSKMNSIRENTELKDFFLNDLHSSNFVVDKKGVLRVVDLDSCKIADNKIFPSLYLTCYKFIKYKIYGKYEKNEYNIIIPNEETDLYCYCMVILNFLLGEKIHMYSLEEFYLYLNYLEYIGISKELVNCFYRLFDTGPNINPEPYIETLTDEQIGRAREIVYKLNRKKLLNRN